MKIKNAEPADVPVILGFIRELAVYEKEPDAVKMTEAQLHDFLFGIKPRAEALLVEVDGAVQAMALWFETFNTWTGRPGMYVEDVFVRAACRGQGVGRAIFAHLAKLAVARDYARMEWSVLDWNTPSIKFYQGLGAESQAHWHKYRLSGDALHAVAA